MKMTCMGIDISDNDISCSKNIVDDVNRDLSKIVDDNLTFSRVSNVTGDDIAICSIIKDDNTLASVNNEILNVLKNNARGFEDLNGIGHDKSTAGEGMSYAEIDLNPDPEIYPDAVVIAFDTYCGESFVGDVAKRAFNAAKGMDYVRDISVSVVDEIKEIPGVGYVSNITDDPVIVASVENVNHVGSVAGAMIGAVLGSQNTYLVESGSGANVIPGSVIFTVSAIMNYNVIDLAIPFNNRMNVLK